MLEKIRKEQQIAKWHDTEFLEVLNSIKNNTLDFKLRILDYIGIKDCDEASIDINEVTIPEFISYSLGHKYLRIEASVLQAFQTYRYSIYDILSDDHYYKEGNETVLKKYGKKFAANLEQKYGEAVMLLTNSLEKKGISGAKIIADKQYTNVILRDKQRDHYAFGNFSVSDIIALNEHMLHTHTRPLAMLSGVSDKLVDVPFSIANALCALEDLEGALLAEDFRSFKATIPVAFLYEEYCTEYSKLNYYDILSSKSIHRVREYILSHANNALNLLKEHDITNMLSILPEKIAAFADKIPDIYLR